MSNVSFSDFVEQASKDVASSTVDWKQTKVLWLESIDKLYQTVGDYFQPFIENGKIKVSYKPQHLNEENIGKYEARQAIIEIGRTTITLTPIGRLIIGAMGRVDIQGPRGKIKLIFTSSDNEYENATWKLVSEVNVRSLTKMTKDTFNAAIMEVSGK